MRHIYGWGVLNSMRIAFRNLFRPVITMQYPHEKWDLPERSRWAVAQKRDETGAHKCTGCLACQKACPDYVIDIQLSQNDGTKHIDHWRYEVGACMMCGLCVEACPFDAIEMSHEYELARTDPCTLAIDLLTDVDVAKPKRAERPAARPAAASPKDPDAEKAAETGVPAAPDVDAPSPQGEPESLDRASAAVTSTPADEPEAPTRTSTPGIHEPAETTTPVSEPGATPKEAKGAGDE